MSEGLGMPMPSAVSSMDAISSGSNSGDTGRPSTTASGAASLRSLQPWAPPSRKSTNEAEPYVRESSAKRDIDIEITVSGVSRRYLCFSPSGGATSSCSGSPGGIRRP